MQRHYTCAVARFAFFRLLRFCGRALFCAVFRVRISGLEHVPKTPYIACVNHLGWAEGIMVMLFFPIAPPLHGLGERDVVERAAWRRWLFRQLPLFCRSTALTRARRTV